MVSPFILIGGWGVVNVWFAGHTTSLCLSGMANNPVDVDSNLTTPLLEMMETLLSILTHSYSVNLILTSVRNLRVPVKSVFCCHNHT